MATITYKCPSCGSPLNYDGKSLQLKCDSCGNHFEADAIKQAAQFQDQGDHFHAPRWENEGNEYSTQEKDHTRFYSCSSCGSQLITDETTVATSCSFCGSPSILPSQFTEGTKPNEIIPFKIPKKDAEKAFLDYFKKKKLIPNLFLKSRNVISEIRQLYVPYSLFNCVSKADMVYQATQVSAVTQGNYRITTTSHYLLNRKGTLEFTGIPVDSSRNMPNQITESIEPFYTDESIAFSPEVLSGAFANRADVPTEELQERANQRIKESTDTVFRKTTSGFASVVLQSSHINIDNASVSPVLFPMWFITTKKQDKTYTFAINGQTGALTCDIPYSKGKAVQWFFIYLLGSGLSLSLVAFLLAFLGVIK